MKIIYLAKTKNGKLAQAIFHAVNKKENRLSITFTLYNGTKLRIAKDYILSIEK